MKVPPPLHLGPSKLRLLPGLSTCLPPYTSVAPSFTPVSQYSSSLSRWALWFCGPWSVERSRGSPIFIFLISSTWNRSKTDRNKRWKQNASVCQAWAERGGAWKPPVNVEVDAPPC